MKNKLFALAVTSFFVLYGMLYAEEKVDMEQFLKDFDEMAIAAMESEKLPGMAIGIVKGDKVVYLKGFGVKKEGETDKVDTNTVFQLASCSKPITGTVVAAAVSRGFLKWDDKVREYVPSFKMKDGWVTGEFMIKDALSHRSGFKFFLGDDLEWIGYNLNEIIERMQYVEPVSSFRSEYAYQNMVITIGGLAAANAAKKDFNELAKELLFKPLEMNNSGYYFKDYDESENKAYGHVKDDNGQWVVRYTRHPDAQFGGGGVSSTAHDIANWMIMYLNGGRFKEKQIISEKDIEMTYTPQVLVRELDGVTNFYAQGLNISYDTKKGYRFFSHNGAFSTGIRSMIYMLPDEKLGIAVLTNAFPSGLPEGLCIGGALLYMAGSKTEVNIEFMDSNELMVKFYSVGEKEKAKETYEKAKNFMMEGFKAAMEEWGEKAVGEAPRAPLALEKYVGKYKSDYYDMLEIKKVNDKLEGYLGKHRVKLSLKPYDGNVFSFKFITIDGDESTGLLRFELGTNGKFVEARMTSFDSGVFKKVD